MFRADNLRFYETLPLMVWAQGGRIGLGTRLLLELDSWLLSNTGIEKCSACQKVVAINTLCSERHGPQSFYSILKDNLYSLFQPNF